MPALNTRCDPVAVRQLCARMADQWDGARVIDAIVAAQTIIFHGLIASSLDLEGALTNVDRLADDLKAELRRKLGN